MQIKNLAIGDGFVYLMEGSTKVKFYVLAHNYESGLNGKGRTLFCRESPATSGTHTTSAKDNYTVDRNNEATWYKNTYAKKFSDEVRNLIGTTKYYGCYCYSTSQSYEDEPNVSTIYAEYESSFFPLSTAEVAPNGFTDGSALSSAAISRIANIRTRYGSGIWTRSPDRSYTYKPPISSESWYFARSKYIASASGSSLSTAPGGYGTPLGYLPCFTLPETYTSTRTASPLRTSRRRSLPMQARAAWRWARKTSHLL